MYEYSDYDDNPAECTHNGEQFENARGDLKCMECGTVIEWAADRELDDMEGPSYEEFRAAVRERGGVMALDSFATEASETKLAALIARHEREENYLPHPPVYSTDQEYTRKYRRYMDLRAKKEKR